MIVEKFPLEKTNRFSQFFLDYISEKEALKPFYNHYPKLNNFKSQIKSKKFSLKKRQILYQILKSQYSELEISEKVKANIEALKLEHTFTITTGHQLNIFTGPLYFIYKIITVVNAAKELKKIYSDYNFVPVYWMGSEDHDFDEIKYFNLFGKKHVWETDQTGATGRFVTKSMNALIKQLPEKVELFEKAYLQHKTLSEAVRYYVNELLGLEGIVVVESDNRNFKQEFTKIMEDDIFNHHANDLVEETSSQLLTLNYKAQIFPRIINFFYLKGNLRERIIKENNGWKVNNTDLYFSEDEIKNLLKNEPEVFSPNVIMRPLYQETILPNLAYVGGPGELLYWLYLKSTFEYYNLSFPILMPRNFALIINKLSKKKMDKLGVSVENLFSSKEVLKKNYLLKNVDNQVDLSEDKVGLKSVFDNISLQTKQIDDSLEGFIRAEYSKALKSINTIEKRLKKSEEIKHEVALNQITAFKKKLFPKGGLQERHDNFLNIYINNPDFIQELINSFNPFDVNMNVLIDK